MFSISEAADTRKTPLGDDQNPSVRRASSFVLTRRIIRDRLFPYNGLMTIRSVAAIVVTAGGFLWLATQPAAQNTSQSNALRVLVSNGMKGTMEELQPQCEKAVGRSLAIQFGSTASLKK